MHVRSLLLLFIANIFFSFEALAIPPVGFGVFTGTETTIAGDPTDLNQTTSPLKWSTSSADSTYFSHSTSSFSHEISIQSFGDYKLSLSVPLELQDTSSVRRQVIAEVYVNGVAQPHGRAASSYIRQTSSHNSSSLHLNILLENLSVNDKITIQFTAGAAAGRVTTPGAQLSIEYIAVAKSIFTARATQTTLGTNLNQVGLGALQWTESIEDTDYTHSASSENIDLAAGDYMVYVNIPLYDNSGCAGRTSPRMTIRLDGATVTGGTAAQGYIRCIDNHDSSSLHWVGLLEGVTGGQTLTVQTQAETTRTDSVIVPSGREASIYIEKVTASSEFISLTGTSLLAGTDWNSSIGSPVQWSSQLAYDASTFTHNTGSNNHIVTIANDGDYFLTFNSHLTSAAQRPNLSTRVKVNGGVVSTSTCSTQYIRNSEGHAESSCSMSQYLQGLSNGDQVLLEVIQEANNGTVNDASPGRLTLQRVGPASDSGTCSTIIDCTPSLVLHYDGQQLQTLKDDANRPANDVSFDGNVATLEDVSGSSNTHDSTQGTGGNEPTFNTVTSGLTFDGTDYFDIANHTDLNTGTLKEKSIVTVFQTGADVTTPQVIYEEGGTVRGMNVYIRAGNMYIAFWNLNNDGDGAQAFTSASTPVAANTFYYASLVIDYSNYAGPAGPDGQLRGHINGVAFGSLGTTTSLLYPHAGAIALGAMRNDTYFDTGAQGGNGHEFNGEIYEFLIYNSAISNSDAVDFYTFLKNKWPDPQPITDLALTETYTTDNTLSPELTWTASVSPDVNDYQTAVGTTAGATDVQAFTSQGNVTSVNISGLTLSECVDYYATVKALDSGLEESTEVISDFFRYDGTDPTDPSGINISGTASVTTSKDFSWTTSTDACSFAGYDVSIGSAAGLDDVVAWVDIGNTTSHTFTGIAPNLATATNYFFNIRGRDDAGNLSNVVSSASWQVDTCVASDVTNPTAAGVPSVVGDAGPTASPTHTWTASTDACGLSHYEIGIGTSAGATDVVGLTDIGDVLTHKFFSITPTLATNTNYYTTVVAVDLAGNPATAANSAAWQLPTPGGVSSGLTLWLDANDPGTLFTDNGCSTPATLDNGVIGCWQDKSTSTNDATATGGNRPTLQLNEFNNQSIVRFDGTDDALDFTNINTARTIFVVNKSDGSNFQPVLGHTTSQNFYTTNNTLLDGTISSSNLRSGSWRADQVVVSGPTSFTQTNSYSLLSVVASGNVETDHIASDRKTGGRFFGGDVVEVIIYNRALNSTEITDVETYLYNKWFTAIPAAVTDLAFASGYSTLSSESPTFNWTHSGAPDLNHYEAALGTAQGSNDISGWTNIGLVNSYQFLGQSLTECQDIYASIRAVDNDSYTSSFASTSVGQFDGTNPSAPSSLILSGTSSPTDSLTLSWSPSTDNCSSATYEVALGTTAGGNDVIDWTGTAATTYEFTSIAPNLAYATDYYLSVRAVDTAGNVTSAVSSSSWQLDTCISTDVTPPTDPSSLNLTGSGSVIKSPSFSWNPSSDSCAFDHYEVAIGLSDGASGVTGFVDIGTSTSYQFTNLASNLNFSTNYFLTVKAVDSAGNDSGSISTSAWQLTSPGGVSPVGMELWLDAQDSITLFQDNGCSTTPVSADNQRAQCVRDKSGSDNHATNASSSNAPLYRTSQFNSNPSLYFNGGLDEFLTFNSTISNIRTVFWVIREDSSNPGNTAFLLGDSAGATFDFHRDSTSGPIFSAANASANVTGGTLQLNKNAIVGTTNNMPTTESVLSLVTTGNATADSFSQDRTSCCSSRTWGGYASEVIIFNRALSGVEVADVENYLMLKWGVTSSDTTWLGSTSTDWFTPGNWSNGVPSSTQNCTIPDQANDPVINGTGICRNVQITNGTLTLQNTTNSTLSVYGDFTNTGTLNYNDGQLQLRDDGVTNTNQTLVSSTTIDDLQFNKVAGGTVSVSGTTLTVDALTMPSGSFFEFEVPNGNTLNLTTGLTLDAGTFTLDSGATLNITNGQSIAMSAGTFQITGTNDVYPQSTSNKGTITSSGRWGFTATGGTVSLTGFILNNLNVSGLQINGTTSLNAFDGGQFTNLLNDFATPVRALVLNTSSSLGDTLASNIGFSWNSANATYSGTATPSDNYYLVHANNCNNSVLVFDQWFGDFWGTAPQPSTEDKIHDTDDGATCQVSMDVAASPVHLLSFTGTPYDQQVQLDWETGSELNHLGFNLYRSTSLYGDYQQINQEMIQNFVNTTSFRGKYRYVDKDLTNDTIYHYMIEDVALNGARVLHGPVTVQPMTVYGAAPDDSSIPDTNTIADGNDSPAPNTGVTTDDSEVLTETRSGLRLRIRPPVVTLANSPWNAAYKELSIPGYGKTLAEGEPELLKRRIYVEVKQAYMAISSTQVSISSSDLSASLAGSEVAPAPSWALNNSTQKLEAQYAVDPSTYSSNQWMPSAQYAVLPETISINGKDFVQVDVWPVRYNPVTRAFEQMTEVVLDISLEGNAWDQPALATSYVPSPHSVENNLIISFDETGVFEFSYDQMVTANVEGPFDGATLADLRAYHKGIEIPIEIESGDAIFNSGDKIRFYAQYKEELDSNLDSIVLSLLDLRQEQDIDPDFNDPLRIESTNNPYATHPVVPDDYYWKTQHFEQNLTPIFDAPIGAHIDHIFWKRIFTVGGGALDGNSTHRVTMNLWDINRNTDQNVKVHIELRGRGVFAQNPKHDLELKINSSVFGSQSFQGLQAQELVFEVPSYSFAQGSNDLDFSSLATYMNTGDYDLMDINKVWIEYPAQFLSDANNEVHLNNVKANQQVVIEGFTVNNLKIYDISHPFESMVYQNHAIDSYNGGYLLQFDSYPGLTSKAGNKFVIIQDNDYKTPLSLSLSFGSQEFIGDSGFQSEYLIIAPDALLGVMEELSDHRQSQGLSVKLISLEQIYDEFSQGRVSAAAIKTFINTNLTNHPGVLKYVLFVGDATYDPKSQLNSYGASQMPVAIESGFQMDFASDNYFVELDSQLPQVAVGRLPSSKDFELKAYIDKLIAYENGVLSPTDGRTNAFISGLDTVNENFNSQIDQLSQTLSSQNTSLASNKINLADYASTSDKKTAIEQQFAQESLVTTYYGHGAENLWGDSGVFLQEDAKALTNSKLPIVIAMNCLNTHYYDIDKTAVSMGESFLFNDKGGSIAFWGSSSQTSPIAQLNLATAFMSQLASETNQVAHDVKLGDLILQAKLQQGNQAHSKDTLQSWTLFGDPALKIPTSAFAPTPQTNPTVESNPTAPVFVAPSGGGGGCSASAAPSQGTHSPWQGLGLEFIFFLIPIALTWYLRRKSFSKI